MELAIRQSGCEAAKVAADMAELVAKREGTGAGVIKVRVVVLVGNGDLPGVRTNVCLRMGTYAYCCPGCAFPIDTVGSDKCCVASTQQSEPLGPSLIPKFHLGWDLK